MTKRLEGKVGIVTGAGSGIGRATALAMARQGADLVVTGRRAPELEATARAAEDEGGRAVARTADVTREEDVEALVRFAMDAYGRLDIGINAAGATFDGAMTHELPESAFRGWIDGHLVSAFLSTKHEVRAMLQTGSGCVVNVGTFVGDSKALAGTAGYAAAKSGLVGLTRTVAAEYAERGVRANLIVPGGADTPMFRMWNGTEDERAGAAKLHAMNRVADPEEIAQAILFLASDEASFVTGSSLAADGGVSLT